MPMLVLKVPPLDTSHGAMFTIQPPVLVFQMVQLQFALPAHKDSLQAQQPLHLALLPFQLEDFVFLAPGQLQYLALGLDLGLDMLSTHHQVNGLLAQLMLPPVHTPQQDLLSHHVLQHTTLINQEMHVSQFQLVSHLMLTQLLQML